MLDLDSKRTALLMLDFQHDIIDPQGKFAFLGFAAEVRQNRIVENAARAIGRARGSGVAVIHVAVAFRKGHPEVSDKVPLLMGAKQANGLVEGTWGAAFHPEVSPQEGEAVVIKRGISAFNGTELNPLLRARGIDTLVLTGVATDLTVAGTALDAADTGYRVLVLQDCCASFTHEVHTAALRTLSYLSTVITTDEFVSAFQAER